MTSSLLARQSVDAAKTPELRKDAAEWLLSIRFVVVGVPPAHYLDACRDRFFVYRDDDRFLKVPKWNHGPCAVCAVIFPTHVVVGQKASRALKRGLGNDAPER